MNWLTMVAALVAGVTTSGTAVAYEEIAVKNGGSITGRVVLTGAVPEPRVFPLVLYPFGPFCKKISDGKGHIVLEEFIVGAGGGLSDAVVSVQRVDKGKPFASISSDFVVVDCMFHPADVPDSEQFAVNERGNLRHEHPLVSVIRNPQPISVINKDPIIHNSQIFQSERGNIVLNFPIPVSTEPRGGLIHLQPGKRIAQMICGMHEFMQSWSYAVDNPYYAKTRKDGEFTIDNIPPGTYRVVAWHPHLAPTEQEVTVAPNGAATLTFEFDGNQVVRPLYESQEKFRVGPEAHPHEHLESCEAPYCDQ
ncbi:MAG: carboxypeptidase regulatory-like domain-containing protein [Nitrospirota bacterium]